MKEIESNMRKIGHYFIEAGLNVYGDVVGGWLEFFESEGILHYFSGRVSVDRRNDITWCSVYKVAGPASDVAFISSMHGIEAELAKTPPWTETRWALFPDDLGCYEFFDCLTGKKAEMDDPDSLAAWDRISASMDESKRSRQPKQNQGQPSDVFAEALRRRMWIHPLR